MDREQLRMLEIKIGMKLYELVYWDCQKFLCKARRKEYALVGANFEVDNVSRRRLLSRPSNHCSIQTGALYL